MSKDPFPGHAGLGLELFGQASPWGGLKYKMKIHLRSTGTDEFWSRKGRPRNYGYHLRSLCGDRYSGRVLKASALSSLDEPCKRCLKAFEKHPVFEMARALE